MFYMRECPKTANERLISCEKESENKQLFPSVLLSHLLETEKPTGGWLSSDIPPKGKIQIKSSTVFISHPLYINCPCVSWDLFVEKFPSFAIQDLSWLTLRTTKPILRIIRQVHHIVRKRFFVMTVRFEFKNGSDGREVLLDIGE